MNAASAGKQSLIQTLLDEASDVDLVCYLAHSGGSELLKELFECLRDAEGLSEEDLSYNVDLLRQKKIEAHANPMRPVIRRLMRPYAVATYNLPRVSGISTEGELQPSASLH